MIRCGGALAAVVALFSTAAVGADAKGEGAGRPMIVKIHADWCGTCTKLETTLGALERQIGDEASIVVLDVTDRVVFERSREQAERLGIGEFFAAHASETGTVGVFDAQGEVVAVMRGELDPARYLEILRRAGARTAHGGS
jgi:thiol-disulfide isomerase/thioredoxin